METTDRIIDKERNAQVQYDRQKQEDEYDSRSEVNSEDDLSPRGE